MCCSTQQKVLFGDNNNNDKGDNIRPTQLLTLRKSGVTIIEDVIDVGPSFNIV